MTQKQQLLQMFKDNGNMITLGQIMKTTLGAEYRARMSDLRKMGYEITCTINAKEPSENIYMLITNDKAPLKQVNDLSKDSKEKCPICGSYFHRGNICNKCGFKFKEVVNAVKTT